MIIRRLLIALSCDLVIAKLTPYGADLHALNKLQDYVNNHKQRTSVDSFYSS